MRALPREPGRFGMEERLAPPEPVRNTWLQQGALSLGVINLIIGLAAFLSPLMVGTGPGLFTLGPGLLVGVFAMNGVHAVAHVVLGLLGIGLAGNPENARRYLWGAVAVFGLLLVMGLALYQPGIYYMLGMANNAADNWLHLIIAAAAALCLYMGTRQQTTPA